MLLRGGPPHGDRTGNGLVRLTVLPMRGEHGLPHGRVVVAAGGKGFAVRPAAAAAGGDDKTVRLYDAHDVPGRRSTL
ncbi:hypothetical protein AB0K09_18400 [Streptomyces sp. NPDC049577]|uniref:hypothetical protein n=1 Tax=Streptomyces sp. NPDC049577 TaxID=3155153 RepID=UPI0034264B8C